MEGDKFNVRVSSWYKLNGSTPGTSYNPVSDLVTALAGSFGVMAGSKATAAELTGSGAINPGALTYYNSHTGDHTTKPKAYLIRYVNNQGRPDRSAQPSVPPPNNHSAPGATIHSVVQSFRVVLPH